MTSFYVGPQRPALRVDGWHDLTAAAQAGVLTETQWVELKAALPAAARGANLELARDLASLSIDGGVLVIGVRDPGQAAEDVTGTPDDLEPLKSRISQVAAGRVQPPLNVTLTPVRHPDDPARHVLLVTVPASPLAPHMVDERYWGRSANGKRPLSDAEVDHLWAQRRGLRDDFEQRLQTLPDDVHQLWPQTRQLGFAQLLLEPPLGHLNDRRTDDVDLHTVLRAVSFQSAWSPGIQSLGRNLPHPDGKAFASFEPGDHELAEEYGLHLLVLDTGALRHLAPATRYYGSRFDRDQRPLCISVNHLMELTHQAVELAAVIGREHLAVTGTWTLGVHLDRLAGLHSAQSLSDSYFSFRGRPYPRSAYTRATTATSEQLQERPAEVVEALLADLARGLGVQRMLFPYQRPHEIRQRGVG